MATVVAPVENGEETEEEEEGEDIELLPLFDWDWNGGIAKLVVWLAFVIHRDQSGQSQHFVSVLV